MAEKNRAVMVQDLQGDPVTAWELSIKEKPKASPGQVVVRMTIRPINPTDFLAPKMALGHLAGQSVVIGSEGVGYVEEVGEGVTQVNVGQRVVPLFTTQFYMNGNGSWQDFVEVSEHECYVLPDSISDEVAAQSVINPWTVYLLMKHQNIPKGEYLLQTAAGSVLGRQVIQLAKHWGIKTINIVRRDSLKEELTSLGADEVLNSTTEDIVARVKEITGGKGVYGAIDALAGSLTKDVVSSVKDGGKVLIYGVMDGESAEVTVRMVDFGRVEIKLWVLFSFIATPEERNEIFTATTKLLADKVITPLEGKKVKLEDFKEAIVEAKKPARGGKVLLVS